ncbi:MAG: hypothetical protein IJD76_02005 [Bacilli bacterium]|nr:hypothetical protein [Bacilli bacterium]
MIRTFKNLLKIEDFKRPFFDCIIIGTQKIIICNLNKDDLFDKGFAALVKYGVLLDYVILWVSSDFELETGVEVVINNFFENFIIFID